jgi:hypothetical protein
MDNMILRKLIIEFLEASSSTCNIDKQKVLQKIKNKKNNSTYKLQCLGKKIKKCCPTLAQP